MRILVRAVLLALLIAPAVLPASADQPAPNKTTQARAAPTAQPRAPNVVATGPPKAMPPPAQPRPQPQPQTRVPGDPSDYQKAEVRLMPAKAPLTGVNFAPLSIEVLSESFGGGYRPVGMVVGHISKPDAQLMCNQEKALRSIRADPKKGFTLPVPLVGSVTSVSCWSVDARGGVERQEVRVYFAGYNAFVARYKAPSVLGLSAGLGYSSQTYTETGITPYNQKSITLKAGIQRPFLTHWAWSVSGYYTVLALFKSRDDVSVRYLGVNGRVGYYLPFIKSPWSIGVWGGAYFATMNVASDDPSDQFGFTDQRGPQILITLKRSIGNSLFVSAYGKFSPIIGDFSDLSLKDNSEKAGGVGFGWQFSRHCSLVLGLDLATLDLQIEGSRIQSSSTSFGFNLVF